VREIATHETPEEKTSRRIATIQHWMSRKTMEIRGTGFYGQLSVVLKFEDGQCVLAEHEVKEKQK